MKRVLLTSLTILIWIGVYSQTPVPPGPISGTWTESGSPYQIMGETSILDGTSLIIEAGVRVEWQVDSCPMWVYGQILAIGTESDSIIFTAANIQEGWGSIRFDNTPAGNDTSRFEYCTFQYGKAYGPYPDNCGGAIAALNFGKIIFDHCYFHDNEALQFDSQNNGSGAIALWTSSPRITNCLFEENSGLLGGAIVCYMYSNPLIENNEFNRNLAQKDTGLGATGYGGAILCTVYADPEIINNIFYKNHAKSGGGAIFIIYDSSPLIKHNLIHNNIADGSGGGINMQDTGYTCCEPEIINNTIANNSALNGGGIDIWGPCVPKIWNTILWGNTAISAGSQVNIWDTACGAEFYYCDIENGQVGFGGNPPAVYDSCIMADPLFEDPVMGNYHLGSGSPCIDKGCPTMTDPDGTRCDIGYCYFDQTGGWIDEGNMSSVFSDLICFPNPTSGIFDIRYSISDIRSVQIGIYALTGKEVMSWSNNVFHPGEHTNTVNVSKLPDGVYFIRLSSGNDQAVRKLIIKH
jgi:hypothetical protein